MLQFASNQNRQTFNIRARRDFEKLCFSKLIFETTGAGKALVAFQTNIRGRRIMIKYIIVEDVSELDPVLTSFLLK
jgi:hypothetical protein